MAHAGVIGIGVGRVQRALVEVDVGAGVAGVLGRFVEADQAGAVLGARVGADAVAGLVLGNPVVAVAAQGQDGLGLVQVGELLVEVLLEPVLAAHRPRRRRGPVLVISHQHQGVGRRLELVEHGRLLAEQGGHPDFPAQRVERLVGLGDQLRIGLHRLRREVLEIEDVAGVAARLGQGDQVVDHGVPSRGIQHQGVGERAVPGAIVRVVDHRQHGRLVRRPGEQRLGLRIVGDVEQAERALGRDPLGGEDVELADMAVQGNPRALVPRHVEAHRQRLGRRPGGIPVAARHARERGVEPDLPGRLHVQRREHAGVLQVHVRQARGEGQGGEEGGDHGGHGGQQQPQQQGSAPGPTSRGVVKYEFAHWGTGTPELPNYSRAAADPSAAISPHPASAQPKNTRHISRPGSSVSAPAKIRAPK